MFTLHNCNVGTLLLISVFCLDHTVEMTYQVDERLGYECSDDTACLLGGVKNNNGQIFHLDHFQQNILTYKECGNPWPELCSIVVSPPGKTVLALAPISEQSGHFLSVLEGNCEPGEWGLSRGCVIGGLCTCQTHLAPLQVRLSDNHVYFACTVFQRSLLFFGTFPLLYKYLLLTRMTQINTSSEVPAFNDLIVCSSLQYLRRMKSFSCLVNFFVRKWKNTRYSGPKPFIIVHAQHSNGSKWDDMVFIATLM